MPLPLPSSSSPSPSLPACVATLFEGLLDVHSQQHVAASRLLLAAVLLACAGLHFMGQGRAWAFLVEMGQHALTAQPKAVDYMAFREELQQPLPQPQPQPQQLAPAREGRRPNNSWALPTRAEELANVDLESLFDAPSSSSSSPPPAAAPRVALEPQPQMQPFVRQVSCNVNLPRSPVSAF